MTEQEKLELLRESIQEIRYIRRRLNDLEDTLGLILATEEEAKEENESK